MIEKKDLAYYMNLAYPVHIYPEPDGSGYTAEISELSGCITCANTMPELWEMIEDAKRTWLEGSLAEDLPIPEPSGLVDTPDPTPVQYVVDASGNYIAVQIDLNTWQEFKLLKSRSKQLA